MAKMVEVVIDSVRVSLTNQQRIVVLREVNMERFLPIWIGPYEAEAITIALQEIEVARPQTHDLIKNLLHSLNAQLARVEILSLREDVFYGNLVVEMNGVIINIDSRPSDALALAVRHHVPVYVSKVVMETASITPEQDIQNQESSQSTSEKDIPPAKDEKESSARLSIFEDFLDKLDIDDGPEDNGNIGQDDDKPENNPL